MKTSLLWFDGITWETEVGDIGWTYVLLVVLIITLAISVTNMIRFWREQ